MVTFNVDSLDFVDDEEIRTGDAQDFASRYSSSNSRLELEDLNAGTVGYIPQDISTDLVGGKFAETLSEGEALADNGEVYENIQEAVNNASSFVRVGPGDFRESVTIDTAGLTLEGSGNRTRVSVPDSSNDDAFTFSVANVTIASLSIDGARRGVETSAGSDDLILNDLTIENVNQATDLDQSNNALITNVKVDGTDSNGIRQNDSTGIVVSNCTLKNIGSSAISMFGDDVVVSNNTIIGFSNLGIQMLNDSIIIGNLVDPSGGDFVAGIRTNGSDTDNIIANNRVLGGAGITDSGTGTTLDGNLTT